MGNLGENSLFLVIAATALLLGACGNQPSASARAKKSSQHSSSTSSFGSSTQSGLRGSYTCPGKKNIAPDNDWELDGTGHYEVCTQGSNTKKIAVFAPFPVRLRVCVFPAEALVDGKVFVKPGSDLLPINHCGMVDELGIQAEFVNVNFNAVFIVAEADRNQMQSCLTTGDPFACPRDWSYGKIR